MMKRVVALVLCVLLCIPYVSFADASTSYQQGQSLMGAGEYAAAASVFDTLGAYEDSTRLSMYCKALAQAELGDYDLAIRALTALDDYRDCVLRVQYYNARSCEEKAGELDTQMLSRARDMYEAIPLFLDSSERAQALNSKILLAEAALWGYFVVRDENGERFATAKVENFDYSVEVSGGSATVSFRVATAGQVSAVRMRNEQGTVIAEKYEPEVQNNQNIWTIKTTMNEPYIGTVQVEMLEANLWLPGSNKYNVVVDTKSEPNSAYSTVAELKMAGEALVRKVEGEGIVLLKNDNNVLPLAVGCEISLVGVTVMDPVFGGTGSGAVDVTRAPNYVDVLEGAGYTVVDKILMDEYVYGEYRRSNYEIGENGWSWIKRKAKNDDGDLTIGNGEHVIYVVGRVGGEGNDKAGETVEDALNGDYLTLNEDELDILEGLGELKADGDIASITVIINSANPISLGFLNDETYGIDAALWVGSVGQTGLYAVGDVISGAVNPSGSLPDTWWVDNQLNPVQNNFGTYTYEGASQYNLGNSYDQYVVYQEGIYVGYKYTETRYEDVVLGTPNAGNFNWSDVVAYPLGHGLSYTTFDFSDMAVTKETRTTKETVVLAAQADIDAAGERTETVYNVSVKVTNTGAVAGKKTVQVYAQKPYTEYDKANGIEKAAVELVGYGKTQILQPGESETVTVTVPEYYLTSYDALNTGVYILSEGTYYLTVAENAHAAVNNILAAKGKTVADGMTSAGNTNLVFGLDYLFDSHTYAKAYGTGEQVTSLFDETDINRYAGRGNNFVRYYSRSDWAGTVTSGNVKLTMTPAIAADVVLDDADIPDGAGAQWPVMGKQQGIKLIHMLPYAYDDPQWDVFMDQLTFEELAKLCANGLRMTVGIVSIGKPETVDHNGPSGVTQKYSIGLNGYALRTDDPDKNLKGTCFPCNGIVAATFNDELVQRVGELIGEDCMWAGYAGLYGSGLNIHRSPYAGRVFEYYSEDSILTGLIDTAETRGIQSKGVYVYNKHFVLNDQERNRAGIGTWVNEQALREIYLRAFELPIVYADAKCVMTAFNRLGANWAGAYSDLLTDWLRGEAGMSGFAVTDMYDNAYMVKVHEVLAGNDIPDNYVGDDIREFAPYGPQGEKANALVVQAMRESAKRVLYTVLHSRGMEGY